jgi:hypothetical protein
MGILDSKKRFLDTIVTEEGRRQMANGGIRARYVTFTDADAYYEHDEVSGSTDASERPHFEAFSRPQDMITFESDDVGALMQFRGNVLAGHVFVVSGSGYIQSPTAEQLRDAQTGLLSSSFDNFRDQYIIGSVTDVDDDVQFGMSRRSVVFNVDRQSEVDVDDAPSIFQDRRFTHASNFAYLPPVMNIDGRTARLGKYSRLDQGDTFTFAELRRSLAGKQHAAINFVDTSRDNNIVGQFFEVSDVVTKLDVIDFGEFNDEGTQTRVLFAGRIVADSRGAHTFFNIFTLFLS